MPAEVIDTTEQQVTIRTPRGNITFGPQGEIKGLWRVMRRECRTNAQVRRMAGGVTYNTLIRWRQQSMKGLPPFPEPVLTFPAHREALQLWSRTEVDAWLALRDAQKAL